MATNIFGFEAEKRQKFGKIHEVIAGIGYRFHRDDIGNSTDVAVNPTHDTYHLFSTFVQDEITVTDTLKVTIGSKFEHNSFSGFEIQPSARALWQVTPNDSVWTSASRAVRTPSRASDGATLNNSVFPGTPPIQARISGTTNTKSEELIALEIGYKTRPLPTLSPDFATFYNMYDNLLTTDSGTAFVETSPTPVHLVLPLIFASNMSGEAYSFELGADWRPKD